MTPARHVEGIPGLAQSDAAPRILLGSIFGIESRRTLVELPAPRSSTPRWLVVVLFALAVAGVIGVLS